MREEEPDTPALTAEDTSVCEKHHEISVSESFLGRMTELVKAEFTSLFVRHHIVEDKAISLCWLIEVLSPSVYFDSQFGPVISSGCCYPSNVSTCTQRKCCSHLYLLSTKVCPVIVINCVLSLLNL